MDESGEQVLSSCEVSVHGADADPSCPGDVGHRYLLTVASHQLGGCIEHAFAVDGGVLALWTRSDRHSHKYRNDCKANDRTISSV